MIFGVAEIVWWCSQYFIMEPGDIIVTGTPSGVALGMKPGRSSSTSATWSSSAATASARRSRRSSRRAPDRSASGIAQNKSPGPRPGASACCASVRTMRSVAGEDRSGELVVQAGANNVFLEADIVHERRRRRRRSCRDRHRDIRSWRVQLLRKAYSRPAPTVQPSWLLDAEAAMPKAGTLTVALTLP